MSTQTDKENPFLGLKPYEEKDRKKLYGRDRDLLLMKDRIFSGRTTLLFAASGVGKTSFINAKIIPELQRQYDIVYHNQWSILDPLTALAKSLVNQCPREPNAESPTPVGHTYAPLLAHLGNCIKGGSTGENKVSKGRCLIILDQFEEIFQYHSDQKYFTTFIDKLSELINFNECNARVLFSMREEFLGELSVFDNKIPDLFGNYYRLRSPNKHEAADIIERTCSLAQVSVEETKLGDLVRELTWIDKEAGVYGDGGPPIVAAVEKDIVAPPYLQIACRGLWDSQFHPLKTQQQLEVTTKQAGTNGNSSGSGTSPEIPRSAETGNVTDAAPQDSLDEPPTESAIEIDIPAQQASVFLVNYRIGDARKMLKRFCEKTFASFNTRELSLLITAFDYLVTKKGAKIAYELSSLAEHMHVEENILKPVLLKLSRPDSRILRARGPNNALWFELYHDMYGPIIDDWRKDYRRKRQARVRYVVKAAAALIIFFALIAAAVLAANHWVRKPRHYRQVLQNARLEDPISYRNSQWAFRELRNTWGYEDTARQLWAKAWVRRARLAEQQEKSDEAFLSWFTAAADGPSKRDPVVSSQIDSYLNTENYKYLLASFRIDTDPTSLNTPIFSADGSMLLSMSKDLRVTRWNLTTNERETSDVLEVDNNLNSSVAPSGERSRPGNAPATGFQPETQIKSAAGNLIAGITGEEFCIWRFNNGTKLWRTASNASKLSPNNRKSDSGSGYGQSGSYQVHKYISITPNRQYFATFDEGSVQVYKLTDEKTATSLNLEGLGSVTQMTMSRDSRTLFLVRKDGTLKILNLETDAPPHIHTIPGKQITQVVISPDGSKFLTRAQDAHKDESDFEGPEQIEIWDTGSGTRLNNISSLADSYSLISFCNDNKTVAIYNSSYSAERTRLIKIIFARTDNNEIVDTRVIRLETQSNYDANPDGRSLLTFAGEGIAQLWSLDPSIYERKIIKDSAEFVSGSVDLYAQTVAAIDTDEIARYWNGDDAKQISEQKFSDKSEPNQLSKPSVDSNRSADGYRLAALSPHGKYSAIKTPNGEFIIWDVKNNREISLDRSDRKAAETAVAFSANEAMLAIVDSAGKISFWRNLQEPSRDEIVPQLNGVSSLKFSPDSKYLAAIDGFSFFERTLRTSEFDNGFTRGIKVFEVATLNEMKLPADPLRESTLKFGVNGKMVGRSAKQDSVLVFNVGSNERLSLQHTSPVGELAITPDGTHVLTSTSDGTLWLWDATTGKLITQQKYDLRARLLRISADGKTALVFSDSWIHVFDIQNNSIKYDDGQLVETHEITQLRDASGRNLRSISGISDNAFEIKDFSLASAHPQTIFSRTKADLIAWKEKLSLTFDDNGQLRPYIVIQKRDAGAP